MSASSLGNLNGFMHASPKAVMNSSENSLLGKCARYAVQLGSYLSIDQATATPEQLEAARESLESAAMTLADIANKPLSDQDVAAVNSRLGELAQQNSLPGQDPATNAAISKLSSDDESQKTQNETLAATIAQMAAISAPQSQ